jgi:hypothetical protein
MGRDALTEVLDSTSRAVQRKHLEQFRCDQHEYMGSVAVLSRSALECATLQSRGVAQPGIRISWIADVIETDRDRRGPPPQLLPHGAGAVSVDSSLPVRFDFHADSIALGRSKSKSE